MCGEYLRCEASGGEKGPDFASSTPEFKKMYFFRIPPPTAPADLPGERRKTQKPDVSQDEFLFVEPDAQRGYFDKTDRNLYNDEDLDVPTFLRRGIKIKIKA